jgi:hypothetical protein
MIEQFLQTSLEFFKEIWFQLNSQFGLEDTEAFKFLKPYLLQLQENPTYMGISLAALFLVPYGLIKVRSIAKAREHKLDELMEEMEDDYDEDDPRRLRRSEPELDDEDEYTAKPLFATDSLNDDDDEDALKPIIIDDKEIEDEGLAIEFDGFELEPSGNEEIDNDELAAEPISAQLVESEFDKDLNEFMAEDQGVELGIKELDTEGELMELDDKLPGEDPFSNYSELDEDEQDKAIKDLQDEMERTINQLAQQIDEPHEMPNVIKDMSEIRIGGDTTIDEEYEAPEKEYFLEETPEKSPDAESTDIQPGKYSATSFSELSDSEILASLEAETTDVPETYDYETEVSPAGFTFEPESDIPPEKLDYTAKDPSENFTFEAEPIELKETREPEYNNGKSPLPLEPMDEYPSSDKTDSLIDRLKFLQTRFENRHQHIEPLNTPMPFKKKTQDFGAESLAEPRRYPSTSASVPPDSKKYMDLLESFIFMKDQKKHK